MYLKERLDIVLCQRRKNEKKIIEIRRDPYIEEEYIYKKLTI